MILPQDSTDGVAHFTARPDIRLASLKLAGDHPVLREVELRHALLNEQRSLAIWAMGGTIYWGNVGAVSVLALQ